MHICGFQDQTVWGQGTGGRALIHPAPIFHSDFNFGVFILEDFKIITETHCFRLTDSAGW